MNIGTIRIRNNPGLFCVLISKGTKKRRVTTNEKNSNYGGDPGVSSGDGLSPGFVRCR
jgi:hypothetical protein